MLMLCSSAVRGLILGDCKPGLLIDQERGDLAESSVHLLGGLVARSDASWLDIASWNLPTIVSDTRKAYQWTGDSLTFTREAAGLLPIFKRP